MSNVPQSIDVYRCIAPTPVFVILMKNGFLWLILNISTTLISAFYFLHIIRH